MMKKHRERILVTLILMIGMMSRVVANEDALYGPTAPPGSAFIRVVNLSSQTLLDAKAGNETFRNIAAYTGSPYQFFSPGPMKFQVLNALLSFTLVSGNYYTLVVLTNGTTKMIEDLGKPDPRKATISVYNLSTIDTISLKTADGKVAVVENVAKGSRQDRAINPVKVSLALYRPEPNSPEPTPVAATTLERGQVLSLFVTGDQHPLMSTWIKQ
jgi:alginate O-acetyltransferase complex protein AlgF